MRVLTSLDSGGVRAFRSHLEQLNILGKMPLISGLNVLCQTSQQQRWRKLMGGFAMVKEIALTQGKVTIVDDQDWLSLSAWNWCFDGRYAVRGENRNGKFYMHRQIMHAVHSEVIDHINQNKLDNRRCNLRLVTKAQNGMNRLGNTNHTSRYKGVHLDQETGRWRAQIKTGEKHLHLGRFSDEIEAALAYNAAAQEAFGEFAQLNLTKKGDYNDANM